ncbi:MAG: BamA/TamA family outer membrane protein [Chitinophagaceae bacterium]|nr:BamA/TamA family outer membrane protein [Chitinophagaceae bacterium]
MLRQKLLTGLIATIAISTSAQDSSTIKVRPKYNKVSGLHRTFFGENYRKEWSADTKLPHIKISEVAGGLTPLRLGGGHQTISLRLAAKNGDEWVLRTIVKDPSVLLPPALRETFARDVIDDAMSAQHPFSPLVVPDLAEAAGIPHAKPVIGIVQRDTMLGKFNDQFAGQVCLLEEREPFGNSDNSVKMFAELDEDNDNKVDNKAFLKAMLLDLLISDWDRHPDQWRWVDVQKGKNKMYVGVPRDRDQAFYVNQGVAPWFASLPWMVPNLQGFKPEINHVKFSLMQHTFLSSRPTSHLSEKEWMSITDEFVKAITDEVIDNALKKLPKTAYDLRHNELSATLKKRRDNIPAAMKEYFRFMQKIVDVKLSDKNELVSIRDSSNKYLVVNVNKLTKNGDVGELLMNSAFDPSVTKEFRLYMGKGQDSVVIANKTSPVKIRLIGDEGEKQYNVIDAAKKVKTYDKTSDVSYYGKTGMLRPHISDDTANFNFVPANRFNVWQPLIGFALNRDDGFQLGLGSQFTRQGFRKSPYASLNRIMAYYAFSTSAFKIKYNGEWLRVLGKADLIANVDVLAPQNTQNFFGLGNETPFIKTGNFKRFYRTRFNLYQVTPAIRWRNEKTGAMFSIGPSLQHYAFDSSDNRGRFIVSSRIKSYDSVIIADNKTHLGVVMNFTVNKKNSPIIPSEGYFLNVRVQGFGGANDKAKTFGQVIPEFSVYQKLNRKATIVVADRVGGGFTIGKSAFYQSLFIGGHENLLGYRQYRFAGEHMIYNNFEVRMKIANFTGYIIPGQFGAVGFFDVGRVWIDDEHSDVWHSGVGGGLFFAPAQIVVINVIAGYSKEGWLPYVTMGFRF